jgi:hypothetical protein
MQHVWFYRILPGVVQGNGTKLTSNPNVGSRAKESLITISSPLKVIQANASPSKDRIEVCP